MSIYIYIKVTSTINFSLKITFIGKSLRSLFQVKTIMEEKSILFDNTQTYQNQFNSSSITFASFKSEARHRCLEVFPNGLVVLDEFSFRALVTLYQPFFIYVN